MRIVGWICKSMSSRSMKVVSALVLVSGAGLGCSEAGGGPGGEVPETTRKVAVFRNKPVQGLSFSTKTLDGVTNGKGEFTYLDGEKVTFRLGELALGTHEAMDILTPFEISGELDDLSNVAGIDKAVHISQLLYSFDTGGGDIIDLDVEKADKLPADVDLGDTKSIEAALAQVDSSLALTAEKDACASLKAMLADVGGTTPALQSALKEAEDALGDGKAAIEQAQQAVDAAEQAYDACMAGGAPEACQDAKQSLDDANQSLADAEKLVDAAAAEAYADVKAAIGTVNESLAQCAAGP